MQTKICSIFTQDRKYQEWETYNFLINIHFRIWFQFKIILLPCYQLCLRRHLLVQSQQCKHHSNKWTLLKVDKKYTRTTSMILSMARFYCWFSTTESRLGIINLKYGYLVNLYVGHKIANEMTFRRPKFSQHYSKTTNELTDD